MERMRKTIGTLRRRCLRQCHHTSTSWSTVTGCGSRGGLRRVSFPPPPLVTYRRYVWWVGWRAWNSGGGCTRTSRALQNYPHCQTCTSSRLVSNLCGKILLTLMEANGWSDYVKRRQVVRGRTCAWRCSANSSWWGPSCVESCSLCGSRTTTWRCGTARRRTWRRRRACGTRCGASCSCPRRCPSSTRRTATACARRRRARRPRSRRRTSPSAPSAPSAPRAARPLTTRRRRGSQTPSRRPVSTPTNGPSLVSVH